ncbi:MAG TPA: PDZ domain-containing protein [Polyangiaceae bacterium]|nr:PDZ domain-containing protein [Polyangiaceae bacterium]
MKASARARDTRARRVVGSLVFGALLVACTGPLSFLGSGPKRGTIGAILAQTPDRRLYVRGAPENLGAARAGVRPGDEILLIDGQDVRQMSADSVHRALAGSVGTPVKLTLVRGDSIVRVTVLRTELVRSGARP